MEAVRSRLSFQGLTTTFGIFKEPRGIIRVLQIVFAILAFSTACNGRSSMSLDRGSDPNIIIAAWSYPYKLSNYAIRTANGTVLNSISTANDPKPTAEFYVFTGVTSMLLSCAFLFIYILMDAQYRANSVFTTCDFSLALLWTVFWIAGSSAWAQGVTNIRSQTGFDNIRQRALICPTASACPDGSSGNYANIIVSVIFGYLNCILWVGCVWFVFKETRFFKSRNDQQLQVQPNQYDPSAPPMPPQSYMQSPNSSMR